jgi:uncharacterized membrane protein
MVKFDSSSEMANLFGLMALAALGAAAFLAMLTPAVKKLMGNVK